MKIVDRLRARILPKVPRSGRVFPPGGHWRLGRFRLCGASVQVHPSAVLVAVGVLAVFMREPVFAALAAASYFLILLVHEAGHAFVARRLGYQPLCIRLGFLHGVCELEAPDNLKDDCLIAWGGVAAQAAVALPLLVLAHATPLAMPPLASQAVGLMGHFSLLIAALNLLPLRGLDGETAWRLIPLLWRAGRARRAAKKATTDLMRRLGGR